MSTPTDERRIDTELADGVLALRFVRPAAGNVIDTAFGDELLAAVRSAADRVDEISVVTLTSTGRNFCVGGDVGSFAAAADRGAHVGSLAEALHESVLGLVDLGVPLVAGVQGWAAGAGLSLALLADLLVLERSAGLRAAYGGIGLSPDGGMSHSLPRAVGPALAADMILTNRGLTADEALAHGVAARVVEDGEAAVAATRLAQEIARGSRQGARQAVALLRASDGRTLPEQLRAEAAGIAACAGGPEGTEGVDAFLAKRRPDYATARARG
ncbi:enoyl-CoA hydratase-related protein [Rhodococcus aerolatus]